MRIANLDGRLVLKYPDGATDIEEASDGRFAADPQAVFARWDDFVASAGGACRAPNAGPSTRAVSRRPPRALRRCSRLGWSTADHAGESKMQLPPEPSVLHQVPDLHRRPERRGEAAGGDRRLGSGTGRRHRPACRQR